MYRSAGARQIQEVYNYERTILNAYVEVLNQLSMVDNAARSYETKNAEVEILMRSITIANSLFTSARADYLEVLLHSVKRWNRKWNLSKSKLHSLMRK